MNENDFMGLLSFLAFIVIIVFLVFFFKMVSDIKQIKGYFMENNMLLRNIYRAIEKQNPKQ